MFNPTFLASAEAGFNEVPARGPYTLAMSTSALFLPLPNMTANYSSIISRIRSITSSPNDALASYLPQSEQSEPTILAGFRHQLSLVADLLANPRVPSVEIPWATGTQARLISLHPLSRGTVRLNTRNHLEQPVLDYRTGSVSIDFDIIVAHLRYFRRVFSTPTMQGYGAAEVGPGSAVQSDEALLAYVKDQMVFSFMHPCCTAAMTPRERGGVVGPDLRVHGTRGLRVADMSVLPLLPSAHLSATAYAVGEKVCSSDRDVVFGWSSLTRVGCRYYYSRECLTMKGCLELVSCRLGDVLRAYVPGLGAPGFCQTVKPARSDTAVYCSIHVSLYPCLGFGWASGVLRFRWCCQEYPAPFCSSRGSCAGACNSSTNHCSPKSSASQHRTNTAPGISHSIC